MTPRVDAGRLLLVEGLFDTMGEARAAGLADLLARAGQVTLLDAVRHDRSTVAAAAAGDGVRLVLDLLPAAAWEAAVEASALEPVPVPEGIDPRPGAAGSPCDERYLIVPSEAGLRIAAVDPEGMQRALVSVAREIVASGQVSPRARADGPALSWRGLSLDAVRHAFSADDIARVIDLIAWHDLSVLHLHLTDVQDWRLEMECEPRLTPADASALSVADYDALVAHAAARGVTLVPEIDLPGHVAAALARVPELAGADPAPHPMLAYLDPRVPAVRAFIADVVAELARRSPGGYVHIGGDEAFGMPEGLYAEAVALAVAAVRRAGKTPVAWQEGARSEAFVPGDVLQAWISPGDAFDAEAARQEHPPEAQPLIELVAACFAQAPFDVPRAAQAGVGILASPQSTVYLDRRYAEASVDPEQNERAARLGFPSYEPEGVLAAAGWVPTATPEVVDAGATVVAAEAALWCETVTSLDDAGFLLLPRLAVLAERMWADGRTVPGDLGARLRGQAPAWEALGFTDHYRSTALWGHDESAR